MTEEEFDYKFKETLDSVIAGMAESPEIDLKKFSSMTCFLENLAFFSPVIYGLIQKPKK